MRSEEHTSELQSLTNLVCRLLLEKKKRKTQDVSSDLHRRRPRRPVPGDTWRGDQQGALHAFSMQAIRPPTMSSWSCFFLKKRGPPEFPPFPLPAVFRF